MSTLRNIRMLTRYTTWANERLFDALAKLPEPSLTVKRPAGSVNMLHTLNHSCVVDQIWQAHLEGRPHGFQARNTETHPPLAELRRAQRILDEWYERYADGLSEEKHDEVVHFTFVGGGPGAMSRGHILLHVVNHKTYHRGWVAEMLYQASARPPTIDLPVFLRDVPLALP